jgi:hypothetical protein
MPELPDGWERNVRSGFGNELLAEQEGEMHAYRYSVARTGVAQTSLQLWNAPPRNHDWIAARIGRG